MKELIFQNESIGNFSLTNHINKDLKEINDFTYPVFIKDSTVDSVTSMLLNISILEIKNVIFNDVGRENFSLNLYCSTIYKKLIISNCNVKSTSTFFAIHCLGEVIIDNCIFDEFVDFGDSWFRDKITIKNNVFKKGTNLLGNLDKPYRVVFDKVPVIEDNIGDLELNILPKN